MASNAHPAATTTTRCPCCRRGDFRHWMSVPDRFFGGASNYDLLRCPACFHVWLSNPPAADEWDRYYDSAFHSAVAWSGETSPRRWRSHLQFISKYKVWGSVLDIGCSSGAFLGYLKGGPWKLHGIEADQGTAERARIRTGAEVFAGDVLNAHFPHNKFDVITCIDVLEHLSEPREVLRKVHNWLKPGGLFYVYVPNIMSWEARIFRSCWFGLYLPRHVHHFSTRSLTELANSVGLNPLRMTTPPGSALEQDARIVIDDLARRAGLRRGPLDLTGEASIPWKVVRKGLRLTVEPLYDMVASGFGAAGAIQAVFKKDTQPKELEGISREISAKAIRFLTRLLPGVTRGTKGMRGGVRPGAGGLAE